MTTVVNLRGFPPTIHLGPSGRFVKSRVLPDDVVRIDRRTAWGNPFRIGDWHPDVSHSVRITRDQAIELYRRWLADRLADEPTFLEPLRGKRLACHCSPERCHGDVIAEFLR